MVTSLRAYEFNHKCASMSDLITRTGNSTQILLLQ